MIGYTKVTLQALLIAVIPLGDLQAKNSKKGYPNKLKKSKPKLGGYDLDKTYD